MRILLLIFSLASLITACDGTTAKETVGDNSSETIDKKAAVEEAKAITKAFGMALKSELKAAMKSGGPVNAIEVCNKKAISIAESVSKEKHAMVSRVSLKNRNPGNIPNDWQKVVLEDFDARAAKGEDIKTMGFSKIVENNGKKQLHFMKALPTGDLCLKCHGLKIDPQVKARLDELYPEDRATGYEKGQVRGAVVVVKDLN